VVAAGDKCEKKVLEKATGIVQHRHSHVGLFNAVEITMICQRIVGYFKKLGMIN
jgi:hypothetical protein